MPPTDSASKYCLYLRRSRADLDEERRGAGETLTRHYNALMELAGRMGITIAGDAVYREIVSGDNIADRPEVKRLLRDVEAGRWAGVLTTDVDRLARGDTMDQGRIAQTFLYSHALIITPYKIYNPNDPSDSEFFEMKLFFARREYEQIKRRLQGGRVNAVKEGLYVASTPPFGYIRDKLTDRKGYTLALDADRAPIVRMVFDWYLYGLDGRQVGTFAIANRLNDMGVRTNTGLLFSGDRVLSMLKNPTYAGFVQWRKRVQVTQMVEGERVTHRESVPPIIAKGVHEAIVCEADFDVVQRLIADRRKSSANRGATAHPFAGLVKCGVCGRAMIRQMNRQKPEFDLLKCSTSHCTCRGIYMTEMERAVLSVIELWGIELVPENVPEPRISTQKASAEALATACKREIEILKKQIDSLRDLLEQGVYSTEVYLERHADISARIEAASARMCAAKMIDASVCEEGIVLLKPISFLEIYGRAQTPTEKNALLKSVISRILYHKNEKASVGESALGYLALDVYPNLPIE